MKKKLLILLSIIIPFIVYFTIGNEIFSSNKKLRLSIATEIDSFDPAQAFNDDSLKVLSQVFEPLYQYHYLKRPYEVIPLIAEGMPTVSSDGLNYTIKIKRDVAYHPHPAFEGKRFVKAVDFLNQIKRLAFKPLKSTGAWIFSGKLLGFNEFSETVGNSYEKLFKVNLPGVEIIDGYTIKFKLINPDPNFIYFLAMSFVVPTPIEIIEYYKNDLNSIMVGTGPYKLESWSVNDSIILRKHNDYRRDFYPSVGDRYANTEGLLDDRQKEIPFIDEVRFKIIKDHEIRWKLFKEDKLDVIDVPKNYLGEAINNSKEMSKKNILIKHYPALSSRWLAFNMRNNKITKKIRQAISYAINTEEYLEKLFNNTNLKSNSIYVPGVPGYNPSSNLPYKYDLERAVKLMKEEGYNQNKKYKITYSTRSSRQVGIDEANLIREQLAKIFIDVDVQILEFKEFLKKGRAGELEFFTDQWIYDYPDAENLLQLLVSKNHPGINKTGYSNSKVDELYERFLKSENEDEKLNILKEVENIVNQELPWIQLSFESTYIALNERVKNWRSSSIMRNFLKFVDLK